MLKNVSSNDADWIRDLRIILIIAQKNYVFDAPLDVQTRTVSSVDVVNT